MLVVSQESKRLLSTVLSIQPGAARPAGTACNDDQVAQLVTSILADLPAVLSRDDASVAKDPFAPLSTGKPPHKTLGDSHINHMYDLERCMPCSVLHLYGLHCDIGAAMVKAKYYAVANCESQWQNAVT